VTSILKFKIIDHLRASKKQVSISSGDATNEDESDADLIDQLFLENGHTVTPPQQWGNPDATLSQKDFFKVLELCLEKLPEQTARVFMMREWLELESEEICKELGVSASNLWVLLYRARLRLRECLDLHWFANKA